MQQIRGPRSINFPTSSQHIVLTNDVVPQLHISAWLSLLFIPLKPTIHTDKVATMADRAAQIAGHLNYPKGMLAGQVAIITGSGQGIGAEAARLFANEGARVVVSDIDGGEHYSRVASLLS